MAIEPMLARAAFKTSCLLVAMTFGAAAGHAETWTTPDSALSVSVPDQQRFVAGEVSPPMLVVWVSRDESIKLGVMEADWPLREEPNLEALAKGLAKEIGGRAAATASENRDGHAVLTMTAEAGRAGDAQPPGMSLTQAVIRIGPKVYKVMAVGINADSRADVDAARFIRSLKILKPPMALRSSQEFSARSSNTNTKAGESGQTPSNRAAELAGKIGGVSLLLLIVCGAIYFATRRRKPPST